MKSLTFILIFITISLQVIAQRPYPYLETMQFKNECGDEPLILIHYDKTLGEEVNIQRSKLPQNHRLYSSEFEENDIVTLKLRFNTRELKNEYYLIFSFGPSCDPGFYIIDATTNESIGGTSGLEIYIPGGNSIYTTGHINSTFNKKRKYAFNGEKFKEIKPEFYYVGLKTKTLKPLVIYVDEQLTEKLASLPSQYDIEVLVAKRTENYNSKIKFLVRTTLGLVGWSEIQYGVFNSIDVEGIKFMGD